jgi:AcrR family transcriptional regulator
VKAKKDEILAVALTLFNEFGIDGVTTRDIARKAGMRLGNLTYYFPAKNDIILALVQEVTREVDEALAENSKKEASNLLMQYFEQVRIIFTMHFKYRFIVNKRYGEIISSLPEIQKHAQDFLKIRFDHWQHLNAGLVKGKFATKLLVDHSHAHSHIINILALYWHQEFLIYYPDLTEQQRIDKALAIFFQAYIPYLTPKGLATIRPVLVPLEHY